jgi:hypothetical protein
MVQARESVAAGIEHRTTSGWPAHHAPFLMAFVGVLSVGAAGCGGTDDAGSGAPETTAETQQGLTLTVAGIGSAAPQRGTSLAGRSVAIAPVTLPRSTSFNTPIVNQLGLSSSSQPPDPIGDVGPNHYVQSINGNFGVVFTIYNKLGVPVSPAHTNVSLTQLVNTTGPCSGAFSDPVVNYDPLADRWILSHIALSQDLCVYISDTGDPTALDHWSLYDFNLAALVDTAGNPAPGQIPDYPKLGVWPGAYYLTANDFGFRANQVAVYALDRAAMLAGTSAAVQRFVVPDLPIASSYQPIGVADFDGKRLPPTGAPGMVVRKVDDEFFSTPGNTPSADAIEIWEIHPNFTTPASSTLVGPTTIPTADFDVNLCSPFLMNDCAAQPGTTQLLSVLGSFVGAMWRVQYRNFGSFETLVGNFDVDGGTQQPEHRWFELRRPTGGAWSVHQEQTYAPDATHRWMGSSAMDGAGNLATGYSASSTTLFPSIRYAGRRATDPLSTLGTEATLAAGLQSQTDSDRWGDYSSMNIDPSDDCTFWYTSMYYASASAGSTRSTRIGAMSFPFPQCVPTTSQCMRATQSLLIRDRGRVNPGTGSIGALINSGSGPTSVGNDATIDDLLSVAPVTLGDRTRVNGVVQSQGTVTPGFNDVITGGITQNTTLSLPPPIDISGVVFPAPGATITVNGGQIVPRAPGSYAQATIFSGGRLRLSSGRYFFTGLDIEPNATVEVNEAAGPVTIFVRNSVVYRGTIVTPSNALATVFLGYTGTNPVTLEAPFNGTFVAPNATLIIGNDTSLTYRAQFEARTLEERPGSIVNCDTSAQNDL